MKKIINLSLSLCKIAGRPKIEKISKKALATSEADLLLRGRSCTN